MNLVPTLIRGTTHQDSRGFLSYSNDLDLTDFRRIYIIQNSLNRPLRGWHGHQHESKIFMVLSGKIRFGAVRVSDWGNPNPQERVHSADLESGTMDAFFVPGGFANAILSLESGSVAMVYSSSTLADSQADDYRYPENAWDLQG